MKIINPKQFKEDLVGRDTWFPYYAGYSSKFAETVVETADVPADGVVFDPWNGGGTTTAVTNKLGLRAHGIDLNPAMVITAKGRLLSKGDCNSLVPLADELLFIASQLDEPFHASDPLSIWFQPNSALAFRRLERAIEILLAGRNHCLDFSIPAAVDGLSDLAAYYYVALFRVVRDFAQGFVPSNPTWTTQPAPENRIKPSVSLIHSTFKRMVTAMAQAIATEPSNTTTNAEVILRVASSQCLPVASSSVDLVLTSPPYCTRIDYAVATMLELAVLRFHPEGSLDTLRRSLIGTSTVPKSVPEVLPEWGTVCLRFLRRVRDHSSKASETYYYKNHLQYFSGMFESMQELGRVLKPGALSVMVVQDSYYKEVHNPLPLILTEMARNVGMRRVRSKRFETKQVMANMNPRSRKYRGTLGATECVVVLQN